MKTKFYTFIIFLTILTFNSLFAQGWFAAYSDTNSAWESFFFNNPDTGYAVGYKVIGGVYFPRIVKTTNAGINWFEQTTTPERDSANFAFRCVFFTDINTGFIAVADSTNVNNGRILKTTNGGNNWSIIPMPVNKHMTTVYFINSDTGYASGYGTMLKTTDAGATWAIQNPNFSSYLFTIQFTDVVTGYVIGNSGTIRKTTNGGTNWFPLSSGTNIHLWGLSFIDANTGITVGGITIGTPSNIILRTTNAGNNWTSIPYTYSTFALSSVKFVSPDTGWITGRNSQILKTINGGLNWYNQMSPVFGGCRSSFFLNALTGYVGGVYPSTGQPGHILKTTDGGGNFIGIEPISNEVPSQFQLFQNYPNPFNPSTSIKFGIPKESFIKLVLFDVLGMEVTTLVNEQLKPGSYEVEWDASNYPSGVYFYKFTVGDPSLRSGQGFVETKKMILIK